MPKPLDLQMKPGFYFLMTNHEASKPINNRQAETNVGQSQQMFSPLMKVSNEVLTVLFSFMLCQPGAFGYEGQGSRFTLSHYRLPTRSEVICSKLQLCCDLPGEHGTERQALSQPLVFLHPT